MKLLLTFFIGMVIAISPASAQTSPVKDFPWGHTAWSYCIGSIVQGGKLQHVVATTIFESDLSESEKDHKYFLSYVNYEPLWAWIPTNAKLKSILGEGYSCISFPSRDLASAALSKWSIMKDYSGNMPKRVSITYNPETLLASEKRELQFLYLDTGPAVLRGYRSASIKLDYRFLVCAGEVQMAYSLDRRSLQHYKLYDIRLKGGRVSTSEPQNEPVAPTTIPIDLSINTGIAVNIIAHVKDDIAGEALGMGCFTGQTKTIGTVAKLIGPKATPAEAKLFLNKLRATHRFTNQHLPFPLLNDSVPVPANAVPVTR